MTKLPKAWGRDQPTSRSEAQRGHQGGHLSGDERWSAHPRLLAVDGQTVPMRTLAQTHHRGRRHKSCAVDGCRGDIVRRRCPEAGLPPMSRDSLRRQPSLPVKRVEAYRRDSTSRASTRCRQIHAVCDPTSGPIRCITDADTQPRPTRWLRKSIAHSSRQGDGMRARTVVRFLGSRRALDVSSCRTCRQGGSSGQSVSVRHSFVASDHMTALSSLCDSARARYTPTKACPG